LNTSYTDKALEQYQKWAKTDMSKFDKINTLIKSIKRDGLLKGIGKPERLKHKDGYSREIDKEHRLVYRINEHKDLVIMSCKGHYND